MNMQLKKEEGKGMKQLNKYSNNKKKRIKISIKQTLNKGIDKGVTRSHMIITASALLLSSIILSIQFEPLRAHITQLAQLQPKSNMLYTTKSVCTKTPTHAANSAYASAVTAAADITQDNAMTAQSADLATLSTIITTPDGNIDNAIATEAAAEFAVILSQCAQPQQDMLIQARASTACIILHHSGTQSGTVEAIRRYHIEHNHWADIGYHAILDASGHIQAGRRLDLVGAHAKGRNYNSVGICVIGNGVHSPMQLKKLVCLINELRKVYGNIPVQFHHEQCPNKTIRNYISRININNLD